MQIGGRTFYQLQLLIVVFGAVAAASVHGLRNVGPEGTYKSVGIYKTTYRYLSYGVKSIGIIFSYTTVAIYIIYSLDDEIRLQFQISVIICYNNIYV